MIAWPSERTPRRRATTLADRCRGFSLVELTVVLIIVALLSGGLMLGLPAQRNLADHLEAQRQLENIREALLGFALTKGRLPCPATPALPNTDALAGHENCALEHGVLPWAILGLPESDPWGNRFSYFAASGFSAPLGSGAMASFTLDTEGTAEVRDSAASGSNIASALPARVISHGRNGAGAYQASGRKIPDGSGDELENSNASNKLFVSHAATANFDDMLVWIVPSILKSRMVAAGRLP